MSSPVIPFSDSPRVSAFHPAQSDQVPLQTTQASMQIDSTSEPMASDKSSALPGNARPPSPYRSIRSRNFIPPSPFATSPRGSLVTRPSSAFPEGNDVRLPTAGWQSPNQRVFFDDDITAAATSSHSTRTNLRVHPLLREAVSKTTRTMDSTVTRMTRSSVHSQPSSVVRLTMAGATNPQKKPNNDIPPTASAPHSRATSPIRLFGWSGFHHSHEDPFVPVDPFAIRPGLRRFSFHSSDMEPHLPFDPTCEENLFCCFPPFHCSPEEHSFLRDARYFILDTLPRQIYLHSLFCLPSLYFSRISRVYEDAQLSKPDLVRMIESYSSSRQQEQRQRILESSPIPPGAHYHPAPTLPFPDEWTTTNVSPALVRFKDSWEAFIDSLLREWKTLNLVSALLHSAILTMIQNQVMASDPVIRTAALLSLTSALMSLSYGCIYIVRFGTMRSMYKATRWAEEAARTTTFILWNVWVLLAMPAIWLAWSMIFFVVAILAFVWRYGSSTDPVEPQPLSPTAAIGPRVAISALFFLGFIYLAAIVKTLHNYGRTTEKWTFKRMPVGGRTLDTAKTDARGGEPAGQRGRGTTQRGDRAHRHESPQGSRHHEGSRRGRQETKQSGLSAVTGLGLTGLDDFANPPRSSDEMPADLEKQGEWTETSI